MREYLSLIKQLRKGQVLQLQALFGPGWGRLWLVRTVGKRVKGIEFKAAQKIKNWYHYTHFYNAGPSDVLPQTSDCIVILIFVCIVLVYVPNAGLF